MTFPTWRGLLREVLVMIRRPVQRMSQSSMLSPPLMSRIGILCLARRQPRTVVRFTSNAWSIICTMRTTKAFGEAHGRAKLTRTQVDKILELREEQRVSLAKLAARFGVAIRTVRDITEYRNWVSRGVE